MDEPVLNLDPSTPVAAKTGGIVLAYASPRGIGRVKIEAAEGWAAVTIRPGMRVGQWLLLLLAVVGTALSGLIAISMQPSPPMMAPGVLGVLFMGGVVCWQVNQIRRRIHIVARDGGLAFEIVRTVGFEQAVWRAEDEPIVHLETPSPRMAYLSVQLKDGKTERLLVARREEELRPIVEALWRGTKSDSPTRPVAVRETSDGRLPDVLL